MSTISHANGQKTAITGPMDLSNGDFQIYRFVFHANPS